MFNGEQLTTSLCKGGHMAMSKDKKKPNVIALQNVEDDLWSKVDQFLANHKRIPSKSQLAKAALDVYIQLANNYGIDHDWKPKIPGIPDDVYKRRKGGDNDTR